MGSGSTTRAARSSGSICCRRVVSPVSSVRWASSEFVESEQLVHPLALLGLFDLQSLAEGVMFG